MMSHVNDNSENENQLAKNKKPARIEPTTGMQSNDDIESSDDELETEQSNHYLLFIIRRLPKNKDAYN